ncbi:MAG: hypothetical protein UZ22_OP11002001085 [Microgenomates bacterium OLB23]|nr:MAG: hypothetical protein UZ22_OP11002001085 [Microgenomates bacterium OLB23]
MKKLFITALLFLGVFVQSAFAGNLSVRIENPGNIISNTGFDIKYVTLDILDRPVTVECYKKGPIDGAFTLFSSETLQNGGDSDVCSVPSAMISTDGTYQFYVKAIAGADSIFSSVVSLDVNTSGPGTPTQYSKSSGPGCQFRISFKTADDGETSYVELYRSDQKSFGVNTSTRVESVAVGPNTFHTINNSIPECGKTYYYAVRAFNAEGVPSGVVGDAEITFITTTTTTSGGTTTTQAGAIPVEGGAQVGQPGGAGTTGETTTGGEEGEAEEGTTEDGAGAESAPTQEEVNQEGNVLGIQTGLSKPVLYALTAGVLGLLGILGYAAYKRYTKN